MIALILIIVSFIIFSALVVFTSLAFVFREELYELWKELKNARAKEKRVP